jgi:hypothetical protein
VADDISSAGRIAGSPDRGSDQPLDHSPGRASPASLVRGARDLCQCGVGRSGCFSADRRARLCELARLALPIHRAALVGRLADRRRPRRHDRPRDQHRQPARPHARRHLRSRRVRIDLRRSSPSRSARAKSGPSRFPPACSTPYSRASTKASAPASTAAARDSSPRRPRRAAIRWCGSMMASPAASIASLPVRRSSARDPDPMPLRHAYGARAARPMRLMSLLSANVRVYAIFLACARRQSALFLLVRARAADRDPVIGLTWHRRRVPPLRNAEMASEHSPNQSPIQRTRLNSNEEHQHRPRRHRQLRQLARPGALALSRRRERHGRPDALGSRRLSPQRHPGRRCLGRRSRKVGKDVAEAIFAKPNCTAMFCARASSRPAPRSRWASILDGVAEHMADFNDDRTFIVAKTVGADQGRSRRRAARDPDRRADELPAGR